MEIHFDPRLYSGDPEDFFEHCVRQWGKNSAKKMERRLQQARAANNLSVLVPFRAPGRWHILRGDRRWQISAVLEHPLCAIFIIFDGHEPYILENGSINTSAVEDIMLVEVTADTHE